MARLSEAKSLHDAASTEMTAHWDRMTNDVDQFSSVLGTLTIEVKKARWEWTCAKAEIGFLSRQVTTHERSATET